MYVCWLQERRVCVIFSPVHNNSHIRDSPMADELPRDLDELEARARVQVHAAHQERAARGEEGLTVRERPNLYEQLFELIEADVRMWLAEISSLEPHMYTMPPTRCAAMSFINSVSLGRYPLALVSPQMLLRAMMKIVEPEEGDDEQAYQDNIRYGPLQAVLRQRPELVELWERYTEHDKVKRAFKQ